MDEACLENREAGPMRVLGMAEVLERCWLFILAVLVNFYFALGI